LLLLFDIDGTLLLSASTAHRDALHAALLEVHGVDATSIETIAPAGRTDGEIARAILLVAGVPAKQIDDRADRVREACCSAYAELCPPDLSDRLAPGMPELLDWLACRDWAILALVTGNYEAVARLKLRRAGIGHHFPAGLGAFGSDSEDRVVLPPLARRRAGSDGVPYPREETVVVGDTPRDIACAKADGLRCVAVSTGPFGTSELNGADAVARDADELRKALDRLLD
jgi:phosphoglycolate phosphatase